MPSKADTSSQHVKVMRHRIADSLLHSPETPNLVKHKASQIAVLLLLVLGGIAA